jgi:hypothetical protein
VHAYGDAHGEQGKVRKIVQVSPGDGTVAVSMKVIDLTGLPARLKFAIEMRRRCARNIASCLITYDGLEGVHVQ